MSNVNSSLINITTEQRYQGTEERVLFSTLTALPCCVFLFLNATMLRSLRSKAVFRQTCRYLLLFNLLLADTMQMMLSQLLHILAVCRITLTYPLCGCLTSLANLMTVISPLTLVIMSLERFVAVCYPLRHASITSMRNTTAAISAIWTLSSLHILTQNLLLVEYPFHQLQSLQMVDFCSMFAMLLWSGSDYYDKFFTTFLFATAGMAVISTYVGVIIAARSASADKALANKARNTVLLHVVQLALSVSATIFIPIIMAIARVVSRLNFVRILNVMYLFFLLLPRCLSSLIYGIRDQTIRPVLLNHLCCHCNVKAV
ncbi:odorant receptor 131-2 [Oryzias melastigma]|uniref:Olfactory receptor 1496-like n=1 Tax=Oryzias melastigma TaxID=30732 RepID=A0A3B3CHX1_ORYME|nr:odorant receptor 131-2 [Oryzias melastigma]